MNEFIEQKKKEYQYFLKEATHIEVGSQLEIQLTSQLERHITESYNKGVEDAKKWQIEKPSKSCLFVHRYNNKDEYPSLHHAIHDSDELVVTDTEYNFSDTMENFADGEFFIIEQLKEK